MREGVPRRVPKSWRESSNYKKLWPDCLQVPFLDSLACPLPFWLKLLLAAVVWVALMDGEMVPAPGAGDCPDDGGLYSLKDGWWYCDLCWRHAWGTHFECEKHLRRVAEHLDQQEKRRQRDLARVRQQLTIPGLPQHPQQPPPAHGSGSASAATSAAAPAAAAGSAAASAAVPGAGSGSAAASAKRPPPTPPGDGPVGPSSAPPPGPPIAISASSIPTSRLEQWLTQIEDRLHDRLVSLHADIQTCHCMLANVQATLESWRWDTSSTEKGTF